MNPYNIDADLALMGLLFQRGNIWNNNNFRSRPTATSKPSSYTKRMAKANKARAQRTKMKKHRKRNR